MSFTNNSAQTLRKIDPSLYTGFEMLKFIGSEIGIKVTQLETESLFLTKAEPYVDSKYNYAHVLGNKLDDQDVNQIKNFFGEAKYRIKIFENEDLKKILLNNGFKFKDWGYMMQVKNLLDQSLNLDLSHDVKILEADAKDILKEARLIVSEAFDYYPKECQQKYGFLDKYILDKNNNHFKTFVLYENDQPVSTGSYYAFDTFSLENIGTRESARGRGFADLIVKKLLQEAVKLGYNEACLGASEAGVRVYQKSGFEILGKNNQFTNS